MSIIRATCDLASKQWFVDVTAIDTRMGTIEIGFKDGDNPVVHFDNCKFGFSMTQGDRIVKAESWPLPGFCKVQTDQRVEEMSSIFYDPSTEYNIYFWAENAGQRIEMIYPWGTPGDLDYEVE